MSNITDDEEQEPELSAFDRRSNLSSCENEALQILVISTVVFNKLLYRTILPNRKESHM